MRFSSERGTRPSRRPSRSCSCSSPWPSWSSPFPPGRSARRSPGRPPRRARTAVLADSWDEATAAGEDAVARSGANYGLPAGDLTVEWEGTLARGGTVTARVTVRMPALVVPGLGRIGAWLWTASHSELVDRYRSFG